MNFVTIFLLDHFQRSRKLAIQSFPTITIVFLQVSSFPSARDCRKESKKEGFMDRNLIIRYFGKSEQVSRSSSWPWAGSLCTFEYDHARYQLTRNVSSVYFFYGVHQSLLIEFVDGGACASDRLIEFALCRGRRGKHTQRAAPPSMSYTSACKS